jgi:hypothetical protein
VRVGATAPAGAVVTARIVLACVENQYFPIALPTVYNTGCKAPAGGGPEGDALAGPSASPISPWWALEAPWPC